MRKAEVLERGVELITGDRETDYGEAHRNFADIAALWSVTLGTTVEPWQAAACLSQLKLARAIKTPTHEDSWVDMAGYVGLAGELATDILMAEWERQLLEAPSSYRVGDTIEGKDAYRDAPVGLKVKAEGSFTTYTHIGGGRWMPVDGGLVEDALWDRRTVIEVP